jgi:uncharacterized protein YciI
VQPHGTDLTSEQSDVDEFNSTGETSPPSSASLILLRLRLPLHLFRLRQLHKTAPIFRIGPNVPQDAGASCSMDETEETTTTREEELESCQPSASIGRRAQYRQELLAQPSLLLPDSYRVY